MRRCLVCREHPAHRRVAVDPDSAFGSAGEDWIRVCLAGRQEPLLTALSLLPTP
ncbi:hypothetical protein KIV56_15790 [Cryobacterium breve]|uniref:Uncharacterized protein n=1 Tax=Cryobacterium breve TaxID=1259258 RepID=A0ABY7NBP0_9MICO|nr:hypothetical protein [Cryobacterium breve]WBM79690.1 hypothetical protein KIV56_15790 [Cryobacterium breve]